MIARSSSHWRAGAGEREPLVSPSEFPQLSADVSGKHQSWGKVTSRPQPSRSELERIAYTLGITVQNVIDAMKRGLL